MKYLILLFMLLFAPMAFASFAVGLATGMAAGSMMNSSDCDVDCMVKFKICDAKPTESARVHCYQRIKHHEDMRDRNGWYIFFGIIILIIGVPFIMCRLGV